MRRLLLCTALLVAACSGKKARKVPADAELKAPIDAPAVATAADREALARAVPTAGAIGKTIAAIGTTPHPAGSTANEAVAQHILGTLTRLGLRTGVTAHEATLTGDPKPRTIRNFMAIVGGTSDDAIVIGTGYDANDTSVASHARIAALLEVARSFTALTRSGWTPPRTIIVAFWDGSESGDVGLAAWAREQEKMLQGNAFAYLELGDVQRQDLVVASTDAITAALGAPALSGPVETVTEPIASSVLGKLAGVPSARFETRGDAKTDDTSVIATATDLARALAIAALRLADAPPHP